MNINFNISPSLVRRLVKALESLATDYKTVHAQQLDAAKHLDKKAGRTYYQSDEEIYKQEQKEKLQSMIDFGEDYNG